MAKSKRVSETEKRLQKILRGAFSGPPTPLKEIPKRHSSKKKAGASDASAKISRQHS